MDVVERCRETMARQGKSFALASRLLPRDRRDDAAVVYAWCRSVDDAIDDSRGPAQRAALRALRAELNAAYGGSVPSREVAAQFLDVARRRRLPKAYPASLLAGMEMDVVGHVYLTLDDLLLYAYRVASTVGLMMCHVLGVADPRALQHAAHLGLAMQLTNVCRDVREDWELGRLYLPDDLLARHGAGRLRAALGGRFPPQARQACRGVLRELLALADRYYASGTRGLLFLTPRCALCVDVASRVYRDIGRVLAASDCDVLAPRAVVPRHRKLMACGAAFFAQVLRGLGLRPRPCRPLAPHPIARLHHDPDVLLP